MILNKQYKSLRILLIENGESLAKYNFPEGNLSEIQVAQCLMCYMDETSMLYQGKVIAEVQEWGEFQVYKLNKDKSLKKIKHLKSDKLNKKDRYAFNQANSIEVRDVYPIMNRINYRMKELQSKANVAFENRDRETYEAINDQIRIVKSILSEDFS